MRTPLFEDVWLEGRLEQHLDAVYHAGSRGSLLSQFPRRSLSYTKLELARAAGRISRAAGRGGGSTAPGRLLLRLAPGAIASLGARVTQGVILISGTNGKTTTARMLASILEADGRAVIHNRAGANTHWGVATALADQRGEIGVLEVDEAWLPLLCAQLRPRLVVLTNLSRDRLDGYGELERLVGLWRALLRDPCDAPEGVVANADDPLLCGSGGVVDGARPPALLFGIDDARAGHAQPGHPHDACSCAACGGRLQYTRAFVGHLGLYRCPECRSSRPVPDVRALRVHVGGLDDARATIGLKGRTIDLVLPLAGLHNVHNALAAATAASRLGVSTHAIRTGLQSTQVPFGRGEVITVGGTRVHLLLVKNPVGVNATLTMLRDGVDAPLHLWAALNDEPADGCDVSWIWDADWERLADRVAMATCSGNRAAELALRLKYAGWRCPLRVEHDLDASFDRALRLAPGTLFALPTYTALLGLRAVLGRREVDITDWGQTAALAR